MTEQNRVLHPASTLMCSVFMLCAEVVVACGKNARQWRVGSLFLRTSQAQRTSKRPSTFLQLVCVSLSGSVHLSLSVSLSLFLLFSLSLSLAVSLALSMHLSLSANQEACLATPPQTFLATRARSRT